MRILTTCVDPNPDAGAPGVTLRLVAAQRDLGHDVELISYADLPKLRGDNLKPTYFAIYLAAAFLVKKERRNVDVIDTSDGQAWILFAAARLFGNRPLLVNRSHRPIGVFRTALIANICSTGKKPTLRARTYMEWRYREFLWSFDLADVGLVLNQDEASFVQKHTKLPAKSCHVITNSIATAFLGLSAPEQPDRHAPLEIVQIGAFSMDKGIETSIPALTTFIKNHADATVSFLGTGIAKDSVLSRFPPDLHHRIRVVPKFVNADLPALLERAQIIVHPSHFEGYAGSVKEAMACGLAPVISDIPGPTEYVVDGRNGLVVPCQDEAALIASLEQLYCDRDLLFQLRSAAHHDVQPYDWKSVAASQLEIFEQMRTGSI